MHKDLFKQSKLAVISDTEMTLNAGSIEAFEPVVREIDHLSSGFKTVTWQGYHYRGFIKKNHIKPHSKNLNLCPIPFSGGNSFKHKVNILLHLPSYVSTIIFLIKTNDILYTRGPSVPAFITILNSFFFKNKIFIHKYGGGWDLKNIPLFYSIQRWLLKKQNRGLVVVPHQGKVSSPLIKSILNPCLTNYEINIAASKFKLKDYSNDINICFVGNCTNSKGIDIFIDTINILSKNNLLGKTYIAGDCNKTYIRKKINSDRYDNVKILGTISRKELDMIYNDCHFLLLPSNSEGFPKVLIEASVFGCIPIVTRLPGLNNIIKNKHNGILLDDLNPNVISNLIIDIWSKKGNMKILAQEAHKLSKQFTYDIFTKNFSNLLNLFKRVKT